MDGREDSEYDDDLQELHDRAIKKIMSAICAVFKLDIEIARGLFCSFGLGHQFLPRSEEDELFKELEEMGTAAVQKYPALTPVFHEAIDAVAKYQELRDGGEEVDSDGDGDSDGDVELRR